MGRLASRPTTGLGAFLPYWWSDQEGPQRVDSVEKLGFSSRSQLSRPCSRYEKFLLGTSAYNSGRDPAIFAACARAHSSSKERKREARPFFRERPIQGFFNRIGRKLSFVGASNVSEGRTAPLQGGSGRTRTAPQPSFRCEREALLGLLKSCH